MACRWRHIRGVLGLFADSRGQAMTEYVIVTAVLVGVCAYLYHPENGIYFAIRKMFDDIAMMLIVPGP